MVSESIEYRLLHGSEKDGMEPEMIGDPHDSNKYPGLRREYSLETPAKDTTFIKTGGNALQAIDRKLTERPGLISVVVPAGKRPGSEILVACPYVHDRLISVAIPSNATPGSVFFVQLPAPPPKVVTGVPVNAPSENKSNQDTPVVMGLDVFENDELRLKEESSKPRTHDDTDEEYEMVERDRLV